MDEKTSPTPSSPLTATAEESHKRKLQELELNSIPAPEPADGHDFEDQSESKRPRFEINGDNPSESHDSVPQNGHQEVEKVEDEHPEEDEQVPVQDQEHVQDQEQEQVDNEPKVEGTHQQQQQQEAEHADDTNGQSAKGQESAMISTQEPALTEDHDPEIKSAEGQEPKPEAQEELPRQGDVPVPSADEDTPSETQKFSRKIEVPNDKVGVLIGKAGDTIRSLQDNSGAKIQIMRDADADRRAATRPVELVGTLESLNRAEKLIKDVIAEADAGGSPSLVARGFSTVQAANGGEQLEMPVPMDKVGLIIGKGGETIRSLQTRSGARIQLIQQNGPEGEQSRDRIVRITGSKKQIEVAIDMIKDVMNQTVRPSPLSSGYHQQGFRPRGPGGPQWGPRGPHHAQSSGYDYPPRGGSYGNQSSQYPPPAYGNYPPQQAPRSHYGPSWEQRPPPSMHGPTAQGNYNYGRHQGPDSGHPPYPQMQGQMYGPGYGEGKYDHHAPQQHYGHMGSQPTPYAQGGGNTGYGQQDQYNKPPAYPMQPQLPPQSYTQPRPSQPGEVAGPYQGSVPSSQPYGQTAPPQQPYPYASSAPMPQNYPPYGSASTTDGYGLTSATPASAYPTSVPPPTGYGQPVAAYPQAAATGGYGSYPTAQPGYGDQSAVANNATYYQGTVDPAYAASAQVSATAAPGQAGGYAQPTQAQPTYDQSGVYAGAPAPAAYPQYDASQT